VVWPKDWFVSTFQVCTENGQRQVLALILWIVTGLAMLGGFGVAYGLQCCPYGVGSVRCAYLGKDKLLMTCLVGISSGICQVF